MRKYLVLLASLLLAGPAMADWTGKDASGATITFKNTGTCSSVVCVPIAQLVDGTGAAFGVTGSPVFISFGSGVTLPGFTATPTFNLGTLNGAATAAKQPALGTAGTPSADVISVQGVTGGTPQPMSAASGADVSEGAITDTVCAATGNVTVTGCLRAAVQLLGGAVPLGSASGGLSVKTLPALTNTAIAVKAAAGQVYKGQCSNADATHWAYLQLFNVAAASVTMGTTAPADFVGIPPGSNTGFTLSLVGEQFSTAISAGVASSSTGGTAPTTTLDCTVAFN